MDIDGENLLLDVEPNGTQTGYTLRGKSERSGSASVEGVMPGVFSVLINERSFQVHLARHPQGFEVWVGLERYVISLADSRDRLAGAKKGGAAGPVELRAQMPGKIIKRLVAQGSAVKAGEGLLVVEAMKMQNEVKSPKDGTLMRIHVSEGATVVAGELLLVVE